MRDQRIVRDDAAAVSLVGTPGSPTSAFASMVPGRGYTVQYSAPSTTPASGSPGRGSPAQPPCAPPQPPLYGGRHNLSRRGTLA